PDLRHGVVEREVAAVPLGDPQAPAAVGPDAARALPLRLGLVNFRLAALRIDTGDIAAGKRGEPDLAVGRRRDAIGTAAAWRLEYPHLLGARIEAAVDAVLAGEPQRAVAAEGGGVEVAVADRLGKRPDRQLAAGGIEANDGVLAAVGDPGGAVGPLDDAVRPRPLTERHLAHLAAGRVQDSQRALVLRRV